KGEPKCFSCNNFGHISRDCPLPKPVVTCRKSRWRKFRREPAMNELYGFGNQRVPAVTSIGMIKADIEVDNVKGQGINIYLAPDNAQPVDLIIGRTWLDLPHIAYVR
ncbi:uncharacterized protein LOC118184435, partial [Stegodyphus dumicola]|uniref:uncharacterized protein LOC118184435 n=1 Tax=Stegodyphus dumicola TaxID=202533 RepID=UPI0015B2728A